MLHNIVIDGLTYIIDLIYIVEIVNDLDKYTDEIAKSKIGLNSYKHENIWSFMLFFKFIFIYREPVIFLKNSMIMVPLEKHDRLMVGYRY